MIFTDVPAGTSLFIDASTFVFHFSPHPTLGPPCTALLERINRGEIVGRTSPSWRCNCAPRCSRSADQTPEFALSPLPPRRWGSARFPCAPVLT